MNQTASTQNPQSSAILCAETAMHLDSEEIHSLTLTTANTKTRRASGR